MDPNQPAKDLTVRQHFAAAALTGLLSCPNLSRPDAVDFAVVAADALIEALAVMP